MPTISINQQTIFYTHQPGPAAGLTLLLIHGAGGRHRDWPAQIRQLPQTAVYALDLPGHAQSDRPGCNSIAAYTEIVHAFIHKLQLTHVVVAGHSMGGAIAQMLAYQQTPGVIGLVLICTGARMPVGSLILDNILPDFRKTVALITRFAWSKQARPALVDLNNRLMLETAPAVLYGDFYACNQFDLTGKLGDVTLPALVISGTADRMIPPAQAAKLAGELPQSQLVVVNGGGHFIMLEQPQRIATEINSFLRDQFGR